MRATQLLIKPVSGACNMHCGYCFYKDVGQNRAITDKGVMTIQTFEQAISKTFAITDELCTISFQGGEPTLRGLDFYRQVIETVNTHNTKNIRIQYTFQTNGIIINQAWAQFFKENNFLVGISLDGTETLHDTYRLTGTGEKTFSQVVSAAELLKKHKVDFNILTVVTDKTAHAAKELYDFFRSRQFSFLQFIPCLAPLADARSSCFLSPQNYGTFLCDVFDCWYKDILNGTYISIRQFDNYLLILSGRPPEACDMGGICSIQNVIEADGSVYPCDFFALDQYCLGNINQDDFTAIEKKREHIHFIQESQEQSAKCRQCKYFVLCRGGCKRHRFMNSEVSDKENYFCQSFYTFFETCGSRLIHASQLLKIR